jgi:hypothetical protein
MNPVHDRELGVPDYRADLEVDFANEDETGLVWAWLDHAKDAAVVLPGAVLMLRDGEDFAMGHVVELARQEHGTVVRLRLLPGAVEDYHAAVERAAPRSASHRASPPM